MKKSRVLAILCTAVMLTGCTVKVSVDNTHESSVESSNTKSEQGEHVESDATSNNTETSSDVDVVNSGSLNLVHHLNIMV